MKWLGLQMVRAKN